jgi:hypothetical protein
MKTISSQKSFNIDIKRNKKQAEKLSRSDEQSAFLTGGVSNVAKFIFSFRGAKKKFF